MKNEMQLKAYIKKLAKDKNLPAQIVLQNYMLERLLERISISKYRNNFIIKGGFLLASIVGIDSRSTMDMDVTIKGLPLKIDVINVMFNEICNININDDIQFGIKSVNPIRKDDVYSGFRLSLTGNFLSIEVYLKVDITTGDKITPKEITYSFPLMFEERNINILAYNIETILAEKLETIIARSDQNTRMRDFYDVYILNKMQNEIDYDILKKSVDSYFYKKKFTPYYRKL